MELIRYLARTDLFFLLAFILLRKDLLHPWLLARCKEVDANPNGYLDLWARGHYKSTIITFALSIQDVLSSHGDDPLPKWLGLEVTIGIFSCTKPLAKQFLGQIKREFETNAMLLEYFPDILWENPGKDAPMWSLDSGLILKRKSNPKEATIEAWGIVEGQPTGKHFIGRVYDDVVTVENIRSPSMIEKTTQAWELSLNLGSKPESNPYVRYIGTRYHYNDTYKVIMEREAAIPRIHTATLDGTVTGEPVLMTREELAKKRRDMGPYTFNSQMLQNPIADGNQGFLRKWVQFYDAGEFSRMNLYLIVDPANEKKTSNDFTVMTVIGLGPDSNYYVVDWVRDRLSLTERAATLFRLHRKYKPKLVGYEQYGMQADIAHMKDKMKRDNYNFKIIPLGGNLAKVDRIRALVPVFEQERLYLPNHCFKTNYERKTEDLTEIFLTHEYDTFPVCQHDDMLDCLARILHMDEDWKISWPRLEEDDDEIYQEPSRGSAWSA